MGQSTKEISVTSVVSRRTKQNHAPLDSWGWASVLSFHSMQTNYYMGLFPEDVNWPWVFCHFFNKFENLLWPNQKSIPCFVNCLWDIFLLGLLGKNSRSRWHHCTTLHYTTIYPCTLHYSSIILCLQEFLKAKPVGTPKGKALFLTTHPELSPNTDIISFYNH